ncbi:PAS domain S-box protein [Calditrichota bacterium GD2]
MNDILFINSRVNGFLQLKNILQKEERKFVEVTPPFTALDELQKDSFALIIIDTESYPAKTNVLEQIKKQRPETQIILIANGKAPHSGRASLCDFVVDAECADGFGKTVEKALKIWQLMNENKALQSENIRYQQRLEELIEIRSRTTRQSEASFRLMFENNPMPMLIFDIKSRKIITANHSASLLYGYTFDEFISMKIDQLFVEPDEILCLIPQDYNEALIQQTKELTHQRKDGSLIEVEVLSHSLTFHGRQTCYIMIKEITAQKKTLDALTASEKKFRMLYKNLTQGVFNLTPDKKITMINKAARKIFHFPDDKRRFSLKDFADLKIYNTSGKRVKIEQFPPFVALEKGVPLTNHILKIRYLPRRSKWIVMDAIPVIEHNTVKEVFVYINDITPLKKAEKLLRSNEKKLRAILDALPDQLMLLTIDGTILEVKDGEFFNVEPHAILGKSFFELVAQPIAQRFYNMLRLTNRTGEIQTFEFQHQVKGKLKHFEARLSKSHENQILCLLRDISERKKYETDLQKSENRFRILLESTFQAIILIDIHGRINLVNSKTEQLFGYSRDELLLKPADTLLPFSLRGKDNILNQSRFRHLEDIRATKSVELTGMRKDGVEFPIEIQLTPVEMLDGPFVMGVISDLSEKKKLEARMRRIEKLEAIGQLAGGIAHDFNNVLAGIIGLAELSLRKIKSDSPVLENIKLIINKAENAADLVRKLLMFSRQQKISLQNINLNKVVLSNQKILQRYLGEDIHLIVTLEDDLHLIHGDPSAMDQILTNLCINARDAMPDGGELTIQTHNITLKESEADIPPGNYVQLIVADSGIGMSDEIKAHIFEPFFTTKEVGEGTGLGLATVYGLVRHHGGYIQFDSEIGEGTVFRIYFPAVKPHSAVSPTEDSQETEMVRGGNETILLVDDQIDILTTSKDTLESYGYKVLISGSGVQAVDILTKYKDLIDLVISDVVMPDMDGIELRMLCLQIKPDIKFLLMSAFSPKLENEKDYLLKPFVGHQLARKVREILDSD